MLTLLLSLLLNNYDDYYSIIIIINDISRAQIQNVLLQHSSLQSVLERRVICPTSIIQLVNCTIQLGH